MQASKLFHEGIAITNIMDQKLQLHNDIEVAQVVQVANIALLCLQVEVEKRPTMFHVMGMLEGQVEILVLFKHNLEYDLNLATILEDFKEEGDQPLCKGMFNIDRSSSSTNLWGNNYIELDVIRKQCMN
jgi:hypothetical protein